MGLQYGSIQYRDGVGNTTEDNSSVLSNLTVLVALSKGMQTVKVCCNKILWYLMGGPAKTY